ncbi:MAG TPA: type II toxin-antitoxin system prevent-host-death family antitoxin [Terracidiphilus sp.]
MKTNPQPAYTPIGIFEAKTRLSEILRKVQQGERFTITVRGLAVADVVPTSGPSREQAIEAVRQLAAMPLVQGVSHETIRSWIEEGRE